MDNCAFFAFFTDNEKNMKNLPKIACVWKNHCIFVTLLETGSHVGVTHSIRQLAKMRKFTLFI